MPGANCSIFGCGTNRRHSGVGIFRIPSGNDEKSKEIRDAWIKVITRDRAVDENFRRQINSGNVYVCERHFKKEDIECPGKRKRLVVGAVPTQNLPVKSISPSPVATRRELVRPELVVDVPVVYRNIEQFRKKILGLKLSGWSKTVGDDNDNNDVVFQLFDQTHILPKLHLRVDSGLNFTVGAFNWLLPDNHFLYTTMKRSMQYTHLTSVTSTLEELTVCEGLTYNEVTDPFICDPTTTADPTQIIRHTVPIRPDKYEENALPFQATVFVRAQDCEVLTNSDRCLSCVDTEKRINQKKQRSEKKMSEPVKSKAPLTTTSKSRLVATVQNQRLVCSQLQSRLTDLEKEISKNSISVDETLEKDIFSIMADRSDEDVSPHMKFFWEQQRKLLQTPTFGRRYHPHLIRYCLSLHAKSPAAYRELRDSRVLVLPSERTLRDYRNFFKPQPGFNPENVQRLQDMTHEYFDIQRYVVIAFDEMKIQSKLVFNKFTNELIGFVDLGEEELNTSSFGSQELASHALVFFVRGVASDLKYVLAYFLTKDVTSYQIMPLFWRSVSVLELVCNLWVCAAVCDGASPNRLFFQLHAGVANTEMDSVYWTSNVFAPDRKIYFFSDPPHLVKTARNCLFNSGSGKRSRYMWNNGKYLLWDHIAQMYFSDLDCGLHQLPKLTADHINLKSFSKMKVSYAVQVLSNTVSEALHRYYPSGEADETAKFCKMMNGFFDCANVRSTTESLRKRNDFLVPYRNTSDERFKWLEDTFIKYLEDWKAAIDSREGQYTPDERGRMFLSLQTFQGLKMSVRSLIAVTKFLLQQGFEFVLTERFCQDDLEEYFGYQRAQGRRSDNPSAAEFGYNDMRIAVLRDIAPSTVKGNVAGRHSGKRQKWFNVSDEPLPKRKSSEKQSKK